MARFSTIVRDGKLALGSIGSFFRVSSSNRPSGVAAAATQKAGGSQSITNDMSQWSSRTAVRTMASNTGCVSVGDWLMTRRISALAACRSRAARSSLCSSAIPDLDFPGLDFSGFDFADFGLLAFGPADLVFEDLSFEDFGFGIAALRRV